MPRDESPRSMQFLPYGRQTIEEDDIDAVAAVLRGDFLTTGPTVDQFERAVANAVGAPYAVACANGTAGLHIASQALGIGPGDAVIVPSMSFVATANAPRFCGAEVIFADVDPMTGLMTPESFAEAWQRGADLYGPERIKAVYPVHLNGQSAEMVTIADLARSQGIRIVEDACHALGGSTDDGQGGMTPIGSCALGDLTMFSLHPVKTVAMGEGGVITARDPELARRLKLMRSHGIERDPARFRNPDLAFASDGQPNPWYYEMTDLATNYRASDINCALGLSQMRKLGRFVARRRDLVARYDAVFAAAGLAGVAPLARVPWCEPAWHLYAVQIDFDSHGIDRAELMNRLRAAGIGTQVHYLPIHHMPYYQERYGAQHLPGADRYYARCLSLPLFPTMADGDVDRVVETLAAALALGH